MPDIRYVLLSDLHFGAENSVLTAQFPNSVVVDPSRAGRGDDAAGGVPARADRAERGLDVARRLVLGGDVLELALAEDHVAVMVFERFVELAFSGRRARCSPTRSSSSPATTTTTSGKPPGSATTRTT